MMLRVENHHQYDEKPTQSRMIFMMMRVFMRLPIQIMGMGIGMMTIISSHFAMIIDH